MAVEQRRERERRARRRLILDAARRLAEAEGWDAVTKRRLAQEIEYSQPVIYQHFGSMNGVLDAVAVDGFDELATQLEAARPTGGTPAATLEAVARAYLAFADDRPATYEAMFVRATDLRFGKDDTVRPLTAAFDEMKRALDGTNQADGDTATEVLWAALHGIVMLSRHDRLRPDHADARIDALVRAFTVPLD